MKKLFSGLMLILMMMLFAPSTQAASGWFGLSSKLSFLSSWGESIHLFFIFSKEQKIDYLLQLTDKQVNEINGNLSEDVVNRYKGHYQQIQNLSNQVSNKDQVASKIKAANLRQQQVLAKVYNEVPQPAKEAIVNAQEQSSKNVAQVIDKIEGSQEAQTYTNKTEAIQQIEQQGQVERIEQVPMESSPNGDPAQSAPMRLNEINQEHGLNSLHSISPSNSKGGSGQVKRVEPAQPIPMSAPAGQN